MSNLLAPRFVVGFHVNLLHKETSAQAPWHQILLNDNMKVWINQIAILINVETNKCHGDAILVEENVRVRAVEKQSVCEKWTKNQIAHLIIIIVLQ